MKPAVYLSIAQAPEIWAIPEHCVVRTRGNPMDRRRVGAVARSSAWNPRSRSRRCGRWRAIIDLEVADRHQNMMLLGVFAGLALVLATLGLYGLLAYAVAQRSREIGLRIALGATAREVVTMVAVRGLVLAAAGLALGVAGGWAATRAMSERALRRPSRTNRRRSPRGGHVARDGGVVACLVPAARAARVDPMVVLRQD